MKAYLTAEGGLKQTGRVDFAAGGGRKRTAPLDFGDPAPQRRQRRLGNRRSQQGGLSATVVEVLACYRYFMTANDTFYMR